MVIFIHLVGGRVIELRDRNFNQDEVNEFYKFINDGPEFIHYVETNGKNHMIPRDKIVYIDTKFKV